MPREEEGGVHSISIPNATSVESGLVRSGGTVSVGSDGHGIRCDDIMCCLSNKLSMHPNHPGLSAVACCPSRERERERKE